ncbi:hypothetical protein STEG23_031428, partial [Scotinomys teguina]
MNWSQHDKVERNRFGDIKTAAYEVMASEGLEKGTRKESTVVSEGCYDRRELCE